MLLHTTACYFMIFHLIMFYNMLVIVLSVTALFYNMLFYLSPSYYMLLHSLLCVITFNCMVQHYVVLHVVVWLHCITTYCILFDGVTFDFDVYILWYAIAFCVMWCRFAKLHLAVLHIRGIWLWFHCVSITLYLILCRFIMLYYMLYFTTCYRNWLLIYYILSESMPF